jgi:ribosomal protein S18 acetylase RimI-like enzyme
MKRSLSSILGTNSAFWFEKDLNNIVDYKPKIPVKIDMNSTDKTIEWLIKQSQSWVVHPKEIDAALKYNHCWPNISYKDKIIGCIKIGLENIFIVDYNKLVKFPNDTAFIYDTYVIDEMRGKGLAKYLISEAAKFVKTKGYAKVGCHIPPWNKASINAYEEIGFRKISYIRNINLLGVSIRIGKSPSNFSMLTKGRLLKEYIPYE